LRIPYEGAWINDWLAARTSISPDWLAVIDEADNVERRFTVGELNNRANRVASFLREKTDIRKGDFVCALTRPRVEVIDLLFACSKLGAVFFPLNTRLASPEISELISKFRPKVLYFEEDFAPSLKNIGVPALISSSGSTAIDHVDYDRVVGHPSELRSVEIVDLEDPLMILQTGGTTGKPKSAVINHRMILWNAVNTVRDLIVPYDTTITAVPLYHIGGFTYTIPLLFWGGTNILMPRWDLDSYLKLVKRERPTFLFLVPAQLQSLMDSPKSREVDFSSVRFLTAGGAALTPEMIKAVFERGLTQKQGFGMTEMGPGIFALDPWDGYNHQGSIGKPNLLVEARVLRGNGTDADVNESGELFLKGPSIFGGYWNDEEETEKSFVNGWLSTGDVLRKDRDGYYYVVGRTKNIIRSGSESIFPEEVEKMLQSHPAVAEALVFGVDDSKWGEVPKALIVFRTGMRVSNDDLAAFCQGKIAKYKIPKYFESVPEIPKDSMGKISRARLSQEFGKESQD
jgi:fatty-acyl-CoA synthase